MSNVKDAPIDAAQLAALFAALPPRAVPSPAGVVIPFKPRGDRS